MDVSLLKLKAISGRLLAGRERRLSDDAMRATQSAWGYCSRAFGNVDHLVSRCEFGSTRLKRGKASGMEQCRWRPGRSG